MAKFTDAWRLTLSNYFNAGDQPTEAQFAQLMQSIQEGIEEHDHDGGGGGDGIATLGGILTMDAANSRIGIGIAAPTVLLDLVETAEVVEQRLFWDADNNDAGEVDRAKLRFSTKNFTGAARTWGIYAFTKGLDAGFTAGLRFSVVIAAVETVALRLTETGTVIIPDLVGVGQRDVKANADGTLVAV